LGPWWGQGRDADAVSLFDGIKAQNPNTTFTQGCTILDKDSLDRDSGQPDQALQAPAPRLCWLLFRSNDMVPVRSEADADGHRGAPNTTDAER
jgi:hypothetical protein